MSVEFGIFDHITRPPGVPLAQLYEDRIELLKSADDAGFYCYHLAEHHGHDLAMAPNQLVFLGALARETENLRLGTLVSCLPLHHPLRLVEEICMVDQLSDGRLEVGVGRGVSIFEHEFFDLGSRQLLDEEAGPALHQHVITGAQLLAEELVGQLAHALFVGAPDDQCAGAVLEQFLEGHDLAGHVGARNVGEGNLDPLDAPALPEVEVVERAGADAHERIAGVNRRIRRLFVAEDIGSSVLMETNGFHGSLGRRP